MLVDGFDHKITLFKYDKVFDKGTDTLSRSDLGGWWCSYRQTSKEVETPEGGHDTVVSDFTMWWRSDVTEDTYIDFYGETYKVMKIKLHGHRNGMTLTAKLVK